MSREQTARELEVLAETPARLAQKTRELLRRAAAELVDGTPIVADYEHDPKYQSPTHEAIERLNDRKAAVLGEVGRGIVDDETTKRIFSGLDIDVEELTNVIQPNVALQAVEGAQRGVPFGNIVGGNWVDGFATGILLERRRQGIE